MPEALEKLVIIGSGPAGFTAAIYAARAQLTPLLFEGFAAGGSPGGQLMTTTAIENYPGFPQGGIAGPELMDRLRQQATEFGARTVMQDVVSVALRPRPFVVRSAEQTVSAQALIVATGATARRLGVPGEARLWNRGISACAVCDGALPRYRQQPLVVIGGGDSACEEALFLTRFASHVHLVHRRDQLRASRIMQQRVQSHPKLTVVWNSVLADALGDNAVTGARLRNVTTGQTTDLPCAGIFYAIGHQPNTAFLAGQIDLDEDGYLRVTPGRTATAVPGVFAAGDVSDRHYRQAITAAGSGCAAALEAERWLSAHPDG